MAQRDDERKIQAWLNPNVDIEKAALAAYDKLLADYPGEASSRQIIIYGILALAEKSYPEFVESLASGDQMHRHIKQYTEKLFQGIDKLEQIIAQGPTLAPAGRAVLDDLRNTQRELNAIESSVASRYRPMDLSDLDDD